LKLLIVELVKSVLFFPVVYYSTGLGRMAVWAKNQVTWFERFFAFRLSLMTLFTPLYGDYTRQGRIVGFVVRLMLLMFRTFGFALALFAVGALFVIYGFLPLLIIYLLTI